MKFVTFLKIFAICFFSLVGVFAAGFGIMYATGVFTEPEIKPTNIAFEYAEYDVTGDSFTVKVTTTTPDVTLGQLTLSLENGRLTENGTITDNVIEIPKTANIGEDITVKICKTINDQEVDGKTWITGGHSTIIATSTNIQIEPAKAKVNVDVPVYKIEVETRANLDDALASSSFVLDSSLYATLKFYPARSAFQYSKNGAQGSSYPKTYKNAYFTSLSSTNNIIRQVGTTNQFETIKLGTGAEIKGYCFTTTTIENNVFEYCKDSEGNLKVNDVLYYLNQMVNDTTEQTTALTATTTVDVVDIDVDTMNVNGAIEDVVIDKESTLYVSREVGASDLNASNLKILLSSTKDPSVYLQSKLKNVAVKFELKVGANTYYDAVDNADAKYNVIKMSDGGFSKKVVIDETTYYYPTFTTDINNSFWRFTVTAACEPESIVATFVYIEDGKVTTMTQQKSFGTKVSGTSSIMWKNLYEDQPLGINLKIYDSPVASEVQYEEFNLAANTNVPASNLYQTRKFFAYTDDGGLDLSALLYCNAKQTYTLPGLQNAEYDLYEIPDGIIKAKSTDAHNKAFKVLFVTVKTDSNGQIKITDGKYEIDQFSQTAFGGVSMLNFYVTKTLKNLSSQLTPNEETTIYPEGFNMLAYVQGTTNAFEVTVAPTNKEGETNSLENEIFKQAVASGDIKVVAKIGDVETDIVETITVTEVKVGEGEGAYSTYVFSMKVGELPLGSQSNIVEIYVSYKKSATITEYYKVDEYLDPEGILQYLTDGVEIYDGSATQFTFALTVDETLGTNKNNRDNRIIVSSNLVARDDTTVPAVIKDIFTSYIMGGVDIVNNLFAVDNTDPDNPIVDTTRINILLKDKYGRTPINTTMSLRSSNHRVMVVAGYGVTFVASGNAELELLDGDGNVKDTLYFTSTSAGQVTNVQKLQQTVGKDGIVTETLVEYYNFATAQASYAFAPITINVTGYSGLKMFYNSSLDIEPNIVQFIYTDATGRDFDLNGKIVYSWAPEIEERYRGYITFDANSITVNKDFGQKTTFNILAQVPELGIAQTIIISIEPNVIISVNPIPNSSVGTIDINRYDGVYAETEFKVNGSIQVRVKSGDLSEYGFFIKEKDSLDYIPLTKDDGPYGKIISEKYTFKRENGNELEVEIDVTIVFKNTSDFKKLQLLFKKVADAGEEGNYDITLINYIYLNPNAKISDDSAYKNTILYMTTQNAGGIYGLLDLSTEGLIKTTKILDSTGTYDQLTGEVVFELDAVAAQKFTIEGKTLKCVSADIVGITDVKIAVYYEGYNIRDGATLAADGKYYITIKVAPNIVESATSTGFVLYDGQNHLKLINGVSYTFEEIKAQFTDNAGNALAIRTIELGVEDSIYVTNLTAEGFTITGMQYNINASYSLVITLENGHSATFKTILLPADMPLINYGVDDLDLKDILSEEYLWNNKHIAYTLSNAGAAAGTQIFYDAEGIKTNLGLLLVNNGEGASFSVKNEDPKDVTAYAYFEGTTLKTMALGTDKYIMVNYLLGQTQGALTIPYLIKITAELELEIYYPYMETKTTNAQQPVDTDGSLITQRIDLDKNRPAFDMEYLSFDNSADPKVVLNLNEVMDETKPNNASSYDEHNAWNSNKRFKIVKNTVVADETIEPIEFSYKITRFVTFDDVKVEIQAMPDAFAKIDSNGVLTVYKKKVYKFARVEIEISSKNGVYGYYYVSCGEVPAFVLSKQEGGQTTTVIDDISLVAGEPTADSPNINAYKLELANANVTKHLKFYAPSYLTIGADGVISSESSISDKHTNLVIYTKFGELANLDVLIKSTYTLELYETIIKSGQAGVDIKAGMLLKEGGVALGAGTWEITDIQTVEAQPTYLKINADKTLDIGIVDVRTDIELKITTSIVDAAGEPFWFVYTLHIDPIIETKSENTINNPKNYGEVSAQTNATLNLGDLFELLEVGSDFTRFAGVGEFRVEILAGNSSIESITVGTNTPTPNSTITLGTKLVANDVVVTARIYYTNYDFTTTPDAHGKYGLTGFEISSYAVFTIKPNFTMTISYPKAQELGPNNEVEKFYVGLVENPISFLFTDTPLIGITQRVQTSGAEGLSFKVKLSLGEAMATPLKVNGVDFDSSATYDLAKDFTFNLGGASTAHVIFTFMVEDGKGSLVELSQTYSLILCSNIQDVFETKNVNITSTKPVNSLTNPETIYVGDNDENMFNVVKVEFTLNEKVNEPKYAKMYWGDRELDNIPMIKFDTLEGGGTVIKQLVFDLPDLSAATYNDMYNTFNFKFYTDAEGTSEDIEDNEKLTISVIRITTRLELYYKGASNEIIETNKVDFFKTYLALLSKVTWSNADLEGKLTDEPIAVEVPLILSGVQVALTEYKIAYKFDVQFSRAKLEIENNQSVSIVDSSNFSEDLYMGTYGMTKISNKAKYTSDMFTKDSLQIKIQRIQNLLSDGTYNNTIGYATYEPYRHLSGDSENVIYDFLFIAHGAPNEPVTVIITVRIESGKLYKDFVLELVIEHDYKTVSLVNRGGDPNTSANPFIIESAEFPAGKNKSIIFARKDNLDINSDLIFILHANNPVINAASQFNVTIETETTYAYALSNTENLELAFKKAVFGNRHIVIRLCDNYGYEVIYYVQIIAESNPLHDGKQITAYESDVFKPVIPATEVTSKNDVQVVLTGVTETILNSATKKYVVELWDETTSTYYTPHDEDTGDAIEVVDPTTGTLAILDTKFFETSISLRARLKLSLTYSGETCNLVIPMMLVQRYTVSPKDNEKFVRDNREFSLLDVVTFTDNKSKVNYGERYIDDVYSFYLNPETSSGTAGIEDYQNIELYLAIESREVGSGDKAYYSLEKNYFKQISSNKLGGRYLILNDIQGSNLDTSLYKYYLAYNNGLSEGEGISLAVDDKGQAIEVGLTKQTALINLDLGDGEKEFVFSVQVLEDQKLTLSTREITDKENTIYVRFDNERALGVKLDTNAQKTYSLLEEGIISEGNKTSLFYGNVGTGASKTLYISGLSTDALQQLLGITFKSTSGVDKQGKDILEIDGPLTAYDKTYKVWYQLQNVDYQLTYPGVDADGVVLTIDYKVTPVFIGVNTVNAYGAANLKTLFVPSTVMDLETNILTDEYEFKPLTWAGNSSNKMAFKLYQSYNSVAQIEPNEDLFMVKKDGTETVLKGELDIRLNASGSTGNLVDVSRDQIVFKQGFDVLNHHVMVDVLCETSYGEQTVIGSIVLGLGLFDSAGAVASYKNSTVEASEQKLFFEQDGSSYRLTKAEIFEAIVIRSKNGVTYNGGDIATLLNPEVSYKTAGATEAITMTSAEVVFGTIPTGIEISLKIDGVSVTGKLSFTPTTKKYVAIWYNPDTNFTFKSTGVDITANVKQLILNQVYFVNNYNAKVRISETDLQVINDTSELSNNKVGFRSKDFNPGTSISEYSVEIFYKYGEDQVETFADQLKLKEKANGDMVEYHFMVKSVKDNMDYLAYIGKETTSTEDLTYEPSEWQKDIMLADDESTKINLDATFAYRLGTVKKTEVVEGEGASEVTKHKITYEIDMTKFGERYQSARGITVTTNPLFGTLAAGSVIENASGSDIVTIGILLDSDPEDSAKAVFGDTNKYFVIKVANGTTIFYVLIYNPVFYSNDELDFVFGEKADITGAVGDILTFASWVNFVDKANIELGTLTTGAALVYTPNGYNLVVKNYVGEADVIVKYIINAEEFVVLQKIKFTITRTEI